jgi:hypothetical protein
MPPAINAYSTTPWARSSPSERREHVRIASARNPSAFATSVKMSAGTP